MAATHLSNVLYFAEMDAQSAFDTAVNYRAIAEALPLDTETRTQHMQAAIASVEETYKALIAAQDAYRDYVEASTTLALGLTALISEARAA